MKNDKNHNKISEFHKKLSGNTIEHNLSNYLKILEEIKKLNKEYDLLSDYEIQKKSVELRFKAEDTPSDKVLVEAYSLVRQAI